MPQPRSADDKFLALLGRMPAPMETPDIAEALCWSRQNVQLVGSRLERAEKVVRTKGARDGDVGRPSDAWALPGTIPTAAEERPLPIQKDTIVVTPSGEEARVVGMRGRAFVEFEYVTGPERFQRGTLHVKLLRPFQPGRERPEPVRVVEAA